MRIKGLKFLKLANLRRCSAYYVYVVRVAFKVDLKDQRLLKDGAFRCKGEFLYIAKLPVSLVTYRKTVETYSYCRYIASIYAPGFSPFYIVTIPSPKQKQQKYATAFCRFLINRAINVKHLHFNFSITTTTPTKYFYKKLLWTVAQKCKNVESLHVNGTFFRAVPFANSIFCSMLPNLQNLMELVVLDDIAANQQFIHSYSSCERSISSSRTVLRASWCDLQKSRDCLKLIYRKTTRDIRILLALLERHCDLL
uniref:Uncharacterized protein n=1 Tax=Romanomermis culicivorax TaxID=13658 RepID=A0A915LCA8_ROMCU